ncbi:MAG: hypothetical protein GDA49_12305 [Rhodospirillales bacterium]|nr:hypothetical protein [Rhodospirillales bacterium]
MKQFDERVTHFVDPVLDDLVVTFNRSVLEELIQDWGGTLHRRDDSLFLHRTPEDYRRGIDVFSSVNLITMAGRRLAIHHAGHGRWSDLDPPWLFCSER